MRKNTFFFGVIIVESGIILKRLLNQKNVGNVTNPSYLKILISSLNYVL